MFCITNHAELHFCQLMNSLILTILLQLFLLSMWNKYIPVALFLSILLQFAYLFIDISPPTYLRRRRLRERWDATHFSRSLHSSNLFLLILMESRETWTLDAAEGMKIPISGWLLGFRKLRPIRVAIKEDSIKIVANVFNNLDSLPLQRRCWGG